MLLVLLALFLTIALIVFTFSRGNTTKPTEVDEYYQPVLVFVQQLERAEDPYMKRHRFLVEHERELEQQRARKKQLAAAWYQKNKEHHKARVKARAEAKRQQLKGLQPGTEQQPSGSYEQ